jgi:DNA polymerase-3 subunit delta'
VSKAPRPGKAAPRRRAESTPEPPPPGGDGVLSALARVAIDDGLLGQEIAQRRLAQALGSGRPHHAWIVSGPMGVGKCTLAVRFAALLVDPESTPECLRSFAPLRDSRSAELLRQGTHPDVHLIRKELAATSADRELRDRKQLNIPIGLLREQMIGGSSGDGHVHESRVSHSSVLGAGKVFIIDEAELLDTDGQNALLKTLEEPPPHTTILLVASHEDRLLPTIRSRCQRVPCGPLDPASMQAWVDRRLDPATPALDWVIGFAGGSPGLALEAIDHGLHAWNEQLQAIVHDLERGAVGPAMAEAMSELVSTFAERVVKANPDASKDAANRKALGLLMAVLGRIVQERLLAASGAGSTDRVDALAACVDALVDAERSVSSNVNQKLVLANLIAQCAPLLSLRGT